jgi:ribosomal protein L22
MRRFRAAAMGRAAPRIKRTSQVTIVVDRKE